MLKAALLAAAGSFAVAILASTAAIPEAMAAVRDFQFSKVQLPRSNGSAWHRTQGKYLTLRPRPLDPPPAGSVTFVDTTTGSGKKSGFTGYSGTVFVGVGDVNAPRGRRRKGQ